MAAVPSIDVGSMIIAVRESVNCMNVWSSTRSDLPLVRNRIETLRSEVGTYRSTLRNSIKIADHGVEFAEKAQDLCRILMDPTVSQMRIQQHIEQMKIVARLAQWDVSKTLRSFRDSRNRVNEIGKTIGQDRQALREQGVSEIRRYRQADEDSDDILITGAIASFLFPFATPLIAAMAMDACSDQVNIMNDSSREISRLAAAHTELGSVESTIGSMIGHIDKQAAWWIEVETMLTTISGNVSNLRSSSLRLTGMRNEWGTIQGKYREYRGELARVGW